MSESSKQAWVVTAERRQSVYIEVEASDRDAAIECARSAHESLWEPFDAAPEFIVEDAEPEEEYVARDVASMNEEPENV